MTQINKPADRLIVAADFRPQAWTSRAQRDWAWRRVLLLVGSLRDTGVYIKIKIHSLPGACGYGLVEEIHYQGLRVFLDLKLYDIPETLSTDGAFLREVKPELLTVACMSGTAGMRALKQELPDTEVLGVTVLTSMPDGDECRLMHGGTAKEVAYHLAGLAARAGIDGVISSEKEAPSIRQVIGSSMTINTPGVRWAGSDISGDDQKRVVTPSEAIKAGADRIIIGWPIVEVKNPYDAVMRTLDEIASVT